MKKGYYALILVLFFNSCNTEDKKKAAADEKAKLEISNSRVVGVGMIVPEMDIVQLSSPVNGIVKKILKYENDSVSAGTPILELDLSQINFLANLAVESRF